jgi:hypothetical protein
MFVCKTIQLFPYHAHYTAIQLSHLIEIEILILIRHLLSVNMLALGEEMPILLRYELDMVDNKINNKVR